MCAGVQDGGVRAGPDVVAVEADVQVPERDLLAGQLLELLVQAGGEDGAAAMDPDERRGRLERVALEDLVSDPRKRAG